MTGATAEHYTIISADCHAGGSHAQYREYLDPRYLDDFDAWRGKYKNPFRDLRRQPALPQLGQRDAQRPAGGRRRRRRGRLPQHGAAVLPQLRAVRPAAQARRVRAPAGRHPGPQPLARRLVRRVPRAPRRHRPDLPQRHRRRHRGRPLGSRSTACAAACCCPTIPPDVDLGEAALRPELRPPLGRARGARAPGQRARRHRRAQLRPVPGVDAALHHRGAASTRSARSCSCCCRACSSGSPASSS